MADGPIVLNVVETRVLGVLMEKEAITPEYYPLSLNALTNACNQRSNREPVMDLDEDAVRQALHGLEELRLAGPARGADGRVAKYEHWLGEAFNLTRAEDALLCVLLLRGAQTAGELRTRTERLHRFAEISDVLSALQKLMDREPPLAVLLPRQPGAREQRYAHLLSGSAEQAASTQALATGAVTNYEPTGEAEWMMRMEGQVSELKQEVAELRKRIDDLFG